MFKKTVTYKDFNDVQHTEEIYFHMMAPELADLEFRSEFDGSLSDYIRHAMKSGENMKIYTFFKLLVVNSYGRRSEDGARFNKKPEFTEDFLNSPAWEEFFVWLVDDPKNAEAFWNGIFPESLRGKVEQLEKEASTNEKKKLHELSRDELVRMLQDKAAGKVIEGTAS